MSGCGGGGVGAGISVMRVRFLAFLDYFLSFVFLVATEAMVKGLVVALLCHLGDESLVPGLDNCPFPKSFLRLQRLLRWYSVGILLMRVRFPA